MSIKRECILAIVFQVIWVCLVYFMVRRYIVARINEIRLTRRGYDLKFWDAFLTLLGLFLLACVLTVFSGFGMVVEVCDKN